MKFRNVVYINPRVGIKVKDIKNIEVDNYNWEIGYLQLYDMGNPKQYEVYFMSTTSYEKYIETSDIPQGIICRPSKQYMDCNFEDVFGFGLECKGFTDKKIILLIDAEYNKHI